MSDHLHFIIANDNGKTYNIPFSKKKFKIASVLSIVILTVLSITAVGSFGLWTANRHMNNKITSLESQINSTEQQIAETERIRKEQNNELSRQVATLERNNAKQAEAFKEEKELLISSAITELKERSELIKSVMGGIGIKVDSVTSTSKNSGGPYISLPEEIPDNLILKADKYLKVLKTLPVGRPIKGRITSPYGKRDDPLNKHLAFHTGIDFHGTRGEKIVATGAGIVERACRNGGYGNYILINHGNGYKSAFAHMQKFNVKVGDRVRRGQVIGFVGNTGRSTGPHLHFEILKNNKTINPYKFLTAQVPQMHIPRLAAQRKIK